jgi:hypothetical protein
MPLSKEQRAAAEAELEQLAKELKRVETEEIGEEHRGKIVDRAVEAVADTPRAVVEDVPVAFAQGATYDFADEIYGKLQQYKSTSNDPRELEQIYVEARDAARTKTEDARSKSPFLTFLAESLGEQFVGGKAANLAMKGVRKLGPVGKMVSGVPNTGSVRETMLKTGLQGTGSSQNDVTEGESTISGRADNLIAGGVSAATGTAQNLLTKSLGGLFRDPNRLRAKAVGFPKKSFMKEGSEYHDPMIIMDVAKKQQFFSPDPVEFNAGTLNFKPSRNGRPLSQEFTREDLKLRSTDAIEKIRNTVLGSLKSSKAARKTYTSNDIIQEVQAQKMNIMRSSVDKAKTAQLWDKEIELLKQNIDNPQVLSAGAAPVTSGLNVQEMYDLKENYQDAAAAAYKRLNDPANQDAAEVREAIATTLRKFIESEASDVADINKLNKVAAQHHNIRNSLAESIASNTTNSTQPKGLMEKLTTGMLEKAGTSPAGRLRRADIGDFGNKVSGMIPSGQTMGARDLNRIMYGQDSSVALKGMEIGIDAAFGKDMPIAEQVIRTKLPRDTKRFLEMKNVVKMKVAQQMPEAFDYVQDILDNTPEEVSKLLPLLIKSMPHFFVPDDYDRIDGKVTSPAGRWKAEKRIDELDLPNHKKAEMKDRLFKTGEFNDN